MQGTPGDLLRTALARACEADALRAETKAVPLEHWNESVFRHLLIRHLLEVAGPDTKCWSEWNRVDLVLRTASGATLTELKWFAHRPLRSHTAPFAQMKGGPSRKNLREFWASVDNLAASAYKPWAPACGRIEAGYFVLAYCDPPKGDVRRYSSDYRALEPTGPIASIETIVEDVALDDTLFTCKLLTVRMAPAA